MAPAFPARDAHDAPCRSMLQNCREGNSISISRKEHNAVARTGQPATRHVAAVQRAIDILEALAAADSELGTNEIARRTGINVSSISRILATLASGGLVEHLPSTGRYRLGVGIMRPATAAGLRLGTRPPPPPPLGGIAPGPPPARGPSVPPPR